MKTDQHGLREAAIIALAALLNQRGEDTVDLLEKAGMGDLYYSGDPLEPIAIQRLRLVLGIEKTCEGEGETSGR